METGPGNVKIPPGCCLVLRCSKKFTALGLSSDNELAAILGPRAEGDRMLKTIIPLDVCTLRMQTSKMAHWSYDCVDRHQVEDLDLTPLEMPVEPEKLDYHEEMRRIVRDELSRTADAQHQETFEESDDFDVEDDENIMEPTEYEIDDMQEDAEIVQRVDKPEKPAEKEKTHRPVGDPPEKQPADAPDPPPELPPT